MSEGVLGRLVPPASWAWQPLWAVAPRVQEAGQPDLQPLSVFLDAGVVPRAERADNHNRLGEDLSRYLVVRPGDIVFNKLRTWQGGLGVSFYTGIVSPAYIICRPREEADPRFLHYLLRSRPYLAELTRRSKWMPPSQFDIPWDQLRRLPILLPSIDEQRRIADFLDVETGRIRRIGDARNLQIQSLQERELAAIADALSGNDSRAARGDTGWSWLPSIPADWTTGPVYAYFDVLLGKMLNPERAAGRHRRPYLRNANVHWYQIDANDLAEMSFEPDERLRYLVRKGDLLVCEGGAGVAEAAVWDGSIEECYYQKSLHRVRSRQGLPVEWLMYWLRLAKEVGVFASDGNIATIPHLTGEQLRAYRIPIPPDGPARVARLAEQVEALYRLMSSLRIANAQLLERQQALITAAVSGQIDAATARGAEV